MANPLIAALMAHADSVLAGPNGDYPAVLEALTGITVAKAAWEPLPEHNSIWQIVDHITDSKIWQIELLEKGQAALPVWSQSGGEEVAWAAAVTRLKEAHSRLKVILGQLSDNDLLFIPVPELKQTQLELLLSIAAHEAHHSGQIDYLKGLQAGTAES